MEAENKERGAASETPSHTPKRGLLGTIVLDVELVLISVIQGVALGTLASNAAGLVGADAVQYWPYALLGFLMILLFWAQAIVHAISFIDWPLSLPHTFLYFALGFTEVIAFSNLTNPLVWFVMLTIFALVGLTLYILDLQLIAVRRKELCSTPEGSAFYTDTYQSQKSELMTLVPAAILFNALSAFLIFRFPELFVMNNYHVMLVVFQLIFTLFALGRALHLFNRRAWYLAKLYGSESDL